MEKQEYLEIHKFHSQLAEYFDAELEDTEYYENGAYYNHVHKEAEEHKEAIRLLSKVLEEKTELTGVELESWHEDYENSEWAGRFSKVSEGGFKEDILE